MSHIKTSLRLPDGHFELLGKRQSMVALEQVYLLLEMSSWFHSCLTIMVCSYSLSQRFPSHSSTVKNVASVKMCCIPYWVKVQRTAEWRLPTLNATSFLNAQWQRNSRIDQLRSVRCRGWYLWIYNTSQTPTPSPPTLPLLHQKKIQSEDLTHQLNLMLNAGYNPFRNCQPLREQKVDLK